MEDIMGQYGMSLLQMLGGYGVFAIIKAFMQTDGVLYMVMMEYMAGICG